MSKVIAVMGESGAGKTTSMRNLDPKSTFYFDCDKKGLSWKGWRTQYNTKNRNYLVTDEADKVRATFSLINESEDFKGIKTIVVDTLNGLMVADEMRRMNEKGYDKWTDLAVSVWGIVDFALRMREDLTILFVAHSQTDSDDTGFKWTRIKTSGKKLDKIALESKFPTVLLAKCKDGNYVFETRSDFSTAKTPMGAFTEKDIPNDIAQVIAALKDY